MPTHLVPGEQPVVLIRAQFPSQLVLYAGRLGRVAVTPTLVSWVPLPPEETRRHWIAAARAVGAVGGQLWMERCAPGTLDAEIRGAYTEAFQVGMVRSPAPGRDLFVAEMAHWDAEIELEIVAPSRETR